MFPFCFEWAWNSDHYIFLGLLYVALTIIGSGLTYALLRTWLDLSAGEEGREPDASLSYRANYSEY